MSSIVISSIDSAKEASELVLAQLPVGSITRISVILFNEPNVVSFTSAADIRSFFDKNQGLPIRYRKDHDCFSMLPGAGGKTFSTVMIYVDGEPAGYTLVADVTSITKGTEGLPFGGRFTAGPFETEAAAVEFAVKLLVREGVAIEHVDATEAEEVPQSSPNWRLNAEMDPDGEWFDNRTDLLEAWQECLEGLEWYHIFPALKIGVEHGRV